MSTEHKTQLRESLQAKLNFMRKQQSATFKRQQSSKSAQLSKQLHQVKLQLA